MKVAARFRLKPGTQAEYKRRHDEIWPEMIETMRQAGITNYTIWNDQEDLFGYFEVEDYEAMIKVIGASEAKRRWDQYMADILDPGPVLDGVAQQGMELMFEFES